MNIYHCIRSVSACSVKRQQSALTNVWLDAYPRTHSIQTNRSFFDEMLPACLNDYHESRTVDVPLLQKIGLTCHIHEYIDQKIEDLEHVGELKEEDRVFSYSTKNVNGIRGFLGTKATVRELIVSYFVK